nr:U3 small nucleolar ribonucleoprotein protein mpp10-like [Quercus suber]
MAESLVTSLTSTPHAFLQPSLPLYTDAIVYLKHALDPVAADVSAAQQQRRSDARKKRKRGHAHSDEDVLRIKQIHVQGFAPEQIWEQAKRVIDAARVEAERGLQEAEARISRRNEGEGDDDERESSDGGSDLGVEGVDYEVEGVDVDAEDEDAEEDEPDFDGEDDFEDSAEDEDEDEDEEEPAEEFVADKFGLNDGFFSIENFNKHSEFLEQQDARGEPDDAASDEEEVDWDADPMARAAGQDDGAGEDLDMDIAHDDEDDDDEDGPTFGDPDAESEDDDDDVEVDVGEMDAIGGLSNTNNVMYADFFAPPAQKQRKNKKGRPNPHNFPAKSANPAQKEQDDDLDRTMAAVHRDLFEDEDSAGDEEVEQEEVDQSNPMSRRSTHERRKAALQAEIRKLEAANVAKREWTLAGEARAADRPMNSLLEEDLEFERAGKPIPVITAEVSESLEELIKRRILAHDFQDIIRRRPEDLGTGRRGQVNFELDNTKSKKGLAEEYEEEHLRQTDPNFVDARDEKTKKEEAEILALWTKVRTDLDSLSSWHFRPKAAAPQLDIRVDAPAITMEDARPTASGEVAGASQLAPQEVYKGGAASSGKEEVAGKSGLPAAREELEREEKQRRRRREKERIRKAAGNDVAPGAKKESRAAREKKQVIGDLKKGGVKVIGKKGGMSSVEGKKVSGSFEGGAGGQVGGGKFKL